MEEKEIGQSPFLTPRGEDLVFFFSGFAAKNAVDTPPILNRWGGGVLLWGFSRLRREGTSSTYRGRNDWVLWAQGSRF